MFLFAEVLNPDDSRYQAPKTIVVDREILLTELQFRTKTFQPELASQQLDALSPQALEKLVNDYVRSEVLYREAEGLGFGDNDYIIKKRMIQKMDFIIQDVSEAATQLSEQDVKDYYQQNTQDYLEAAHVTFTHVFIDRKNRSMEETLALANSTLTTLQQDSASFTDAPQYGDRFPFGLNYVEKPHDLIASHFGMEAANTLFQLDPKQGRWQGPISSEHGAHLVMLITHQNEFIPPLAEVWDDVVVDVERKLIETHRLKAIDKLVETYTVKHNYKANKEKTASTANNTKTLKKNTEQASGANKG